MKKFDNSFTILDNLEAKDSVSANDLVNVISRILEDAGRAAGKPISSAAITDEDRFANGIFYLCRELSNTINSHQTVFDSMPGVIRKMFDTSCQTIREAETKLGKLKDQIEEESQKRGEAEEKERKLIKKQDELKEEIKKLQDTDGRIDAIEKDIKAKEALITKLQSQAKDNPSLLTEYQNSLTAVRDAWAAWESQKKELGEMLDERGEYEKIQSGINSFAELDRWFDDYGKQLQSAIDEYAKTYGSLLTTLHVAE